MADAVEYGLMLWDGKRQGTIINILNVSRDGKTAFVYIARTERLLTVKTFDDLRGFVAQGKCASVGRVVCALPIEDLQHCVAG
jgi:hypothetical protein